MPDTRDIRISVTELQLIAEQLRDSGREDLDMIHDMIMAAFWGEEDELHDFTA